MTLWTGHISQPPRTAISNWNGAPAKFTALQSILPMGHYGVRFVPALAAICRCLVH